MRVGLIGLGAISSGYDSLGSSYSLTYGKAFSQNRHIQISWGIDPNPSRRSDFQKKYKTKTLPSLSGLKAREVDVVVIAVPTALHASLVQKALTLKPRLIVLEKPLAPSVKEAQQILSRCKKAGVRLYVNYQRRLEPSIERIKKGLKTKEWGSLLSIDLSYSRGLVNNASHCFDLLNFLTDDKGRWDVLSSHSLPGKGDNYSGALLLNDVPVLFKAVPLPKGGVLDIDLYFEKARVSLWDFGRRVSIRKLVADTVYPGAFVYENEGSHLVSGMKTYMARVATHLIDVLKGRKKPISTGETALLSQQLCEAIRDKALSRR